MIIRLHFAILHEFFMSERKKRPPGNPGRRRVGEKVRTRVEVSVQGVGTQPGYYSSRNERSGSERDG